LNGLRTSNEQPIEDNFYLKNNSMQFKITLITGIFFVLINSLSVAHPISQKETPPQKTEQKATKKKRFPIIGGIIDIVREIRSTKGQKASAWSITSLSLGVAALPLFVAGVTGFVAAGLGVITGIVGYVRAKNARSSLFSGYGIRLGAGIIVGVLMFMLMVRSLGSIQ